MRFKMLNYWHINNNEMYISLMRYYVKINVIIENERLFYTLQLFNGGKACLLLKFDTLEGAISFTEDVINDNYSITLNDIKEIYESMYSNSSKKKYLKKDMDN